jgi:pimeloyl-ACP methyl ester carboxylesterase
VLDVGYFEAGPADGPPVLLLHGFPYSVDSFAEVAPMLAARGARVIVPYLRGHGTTRFVDSATPRSGQQAAIGVDVIALMDALKLDRAVLAGYDWGGRAACVAAALWPERVAQASCPSTATSSRTSPRRACRWRRRSNRASGTSTTS